MEGGSTSEGGEGRSVGRGRRRRRDWNRPRGPYSYGVRGRVGPLRKDRQGETPVTPPGVQPSRTKLPFRCSSRLQFQDDNKPGFENGVSDERPESSFLTTSPVAPPFAFGKPEGPEDRHTRDVSVKHRDRRSTLSSSNTPSSVRNSSGATATFWWTVRSHSVTVDVPDTGLRAPQGSSSLHWWKGPSRESGEGDVVDPRPRPEFLPLP